MIKDSVYKCLQDIPQTRGNDNLLIAYVLKDEYNVQNTFDIAMMTNSNLYETISRCRRKIQEENPLLRPELEISNARMRKENHIRKEMRGV